jgi:hypothetical protein
VCTNAARICVMSFIKDMLFWSSGSSETGKLRRALRTLRKHLIRSSDTVSSLMTGSTPVRRIPGSMMLYDAFCKHARTHQFFSMHAQHRRSQRILFRSPARCLQ